MRAPTIGKQIPRLAPLTTLLALLALAVAPIRAAYLQPLTFDTTTFQTSDVYLEDGVTGSPIAAGDTVDMGFVQAGVVGDYPLVLHNQTGSTVTITAVTGVSVPGIYTDIGDSLPVDVAAHSDRLIRLFCFNPTATALNASLSISTSAGDFNFNALCTVVDGSPDIQLTYVDAGAEVLAEDSIDL